MKVLYLASRTPTVDSLALEVEITGVQRRLLTDVAEHAQFIFLPEVKLEEVPIEITKHKPDVLHISVHGDLDGRPDGLWFASGSGAMLPLSADQLSAFLPRDRLPKLILLNACASDGIARRLAERELCAIGATAPITNRASVAAATLLYDRLLNGDTISHAFEAVEALVHALEVGRTKLVLETKHPHLAERSLMVLPRLVAKLADDRPFFEDDVVRLKIGFAGCPESTTQICFFTDDESFLGDEEEEVSLTEVVRERPRGGEVWTEVSWEVDGDCRVGACGITASGATFSASALLSELVEGYTASVLAPPAYHQSAAEIVRYLRLNNGSGLADWTPSEPRRASRPKKLRKTDKS